MGLIRVKYGAPKTGFFYVHQNMGLVRLSTAKICVFIFWGVRTLKLSSKMTKNSIFDWRLMILFIFSILLFDFVRFWQSTIKFFPMKKCNHVSNFMILGRCFWGKKLATRDWLRSQLVLSGMFQEHPAGQFLWELPAKASGVEVESTWRALRGIDPRLVSIKGFESSKGMDLEMSWHQVWEK